ncbi:hypothetical protein PUN28_015219 [Cardiocondyla obscurior]|uniref:Odorant receptor n=1 Tax=Cardiocondyla obscurior TaxID=286306 RepID=A0AAW2EZ65_9HYME
MGSTSRSHYYSVIKKIASLAGLWPYQNQKMRIFCLSLVTLSTFSIIVPQMAKFVVCKGDLQCIFQTLAGHMLAVITLIKLYTCCFNQYKIKILIDWLFMEWDELKTPEEREIMQRYAETGRRYSLGYSLYCFITGFLFICLSLIPPILDVALPLNESRPVLPAYPGHYFVDEREYFTYTFLHAIVAWEIAVTGIVAHDCMLLTYIEHVCSILTLAGFAQLIEDTFSLTLAIQIVINTIMISITLLQITQQNAGILIMVRYVLFVLSQLIHLFCLSFEGQKLIDHSLQTRDKIYNSPWYKMSAQSQKMLMFVMEKALNPIFLSACKIYIFSIENFTTVVQTSMSYFTVLATLE